MDGLKHHIPPNVCRTSPRVHIYIYIYTHTRRNSSIYVFKSLRSSSRAFVGSSNRTVYSRISICTHGSIHICHRRGATGRGYQHATHTLAFVPAFLSINTILFIPRKNYNHRHDTDDTVLYGRRLIIPSSWNPRAIVLFLRTPLDSEFDDQTFASRLYTYLYHYLYLLHKMKRSKCWNEYF